MCPVRSNTPAELGDREAGPQSYQPGRRGNTITTSAVWQEIMLTSGAKVLAGGAIAGITAVTYYIVTRSRSKATRDAQAPGAPPAKAARLLPEEASPRVDEFGLLGQLVDLDEFYELVRHCSAIDAVRLSRCSAALHERLADPSTAAWCAESRRALLRRRRRAGDLPLDTQGAWTLERLHLCERPPRFSALPCLTPQGRASRGAHDVRSFHPGQVSARVL